MALQDLQQIHSQLKGASSPEAVFGVPEGTLSAEQLHAEVKRTYLRLQQIVDPDLYPGDEQAKLLAREATMILTGFFDKAKEKIQSGNYGRSEPSTSGSGSGSGLTISAGTRQYQINSPMAQGDLSTVYAGSMSGSETGKIAVKVVEDPADNDLLQNEVRILRYLRTEPGAYGKHLPELLDEFRTGENKMGIIMRHLEGFDLTAIRKKYTNGIPPRHIIWVFRRTLSVVGYAHSKGVVHGNIDPSHILVSPGDHNVFLIDWAYSVYKPASTGQGFRAVNEKYSAPEVSQQKSPIPASDLFSVGKCMIYLLGGNIETNQMPAEVDERIQRFIQFFVRPSPQQRPQDAWEMYNKLDDLRAEVYGPHEFIEFKMD